jgi:peroxiredoxin
LTAVSERGKAILEAWRRFRQRKFLALLLDVMLIAAVFLAIHGWQTRNLPIDEAAPETVLSLLDGSRFASAVQGGEAGIVYFFAPWCVYCKTSIDNLDDLVAEGRVSWGAAVALSYGDAGEVAAFVEETGIDLPVLMGHKGTSDDWSIRGFPTYYVIDAKGRIHSRSVGYSTKLGMRWRAWRARS